MIEDLREQGGGRLKTCLVFRKRKTTLSISLEI